MPDAAPTDRADQFTSLGRLAQLSRLRRLGRAALAGYGIHDARLSLLRHEQNTTFRVDAHGGPYVLRINRPVVHTPETIGSEMAWLRALRRDTDLGVPEPVPARDGSLAVVARDPGVPEPHVCVLLRWLDGRFVDRGLTPAHLRRVGTLTARLHEYGASWSPPSGFLRPRVDTLTDTGKVASMAPSASDARHGVHPSRQDSDPGVALVEALVSIADAALFAEALEIVQATMRQLEETGAFGVIHGDLHYENFLFHHSEARAIDFDDCGWGFHLYDLAVTLWELAGRPRYDELREALLEGYAQVRPLPNDHATHLDALFILRRLQFLLWVLESRDHAAFRDDWRETARGELDALGVVMKAREAG